MKQFKFFQGYNGIILIRFSTGEQHWPGLMNEALPIPTPIVNFPPEINDQLGLRDINADMEHFREALIRSSGIPREYLNPEEE